MMMSDKTDNKTKTVKVEIEYSDCLCHLWVWVTDELSVIIDKW